MFAQMQGRRVEIDWLPYHYHSVGVKSDRRGCASAFTLASGQESSPVTTSICIELAFSKKVENGDARCHGACSESVKCKINIYNSNIHSA